MISRHWNRIMHKGIKFSEKKYKIITYDEIKRKSDSFWNDLSKIVPKVTEK